MSNYDQIQSLATWLNQQIVGQDHLINRMLIALLADGHLLVEGAPGLAKTKAIKTLSQGIEAQFHRVQFTPDLLPADVTGTDIYRPQSGQFEFQPGPIFHNLVLADEINRAPAKVQSALLEAMAERQVSVGSKTYPLPKLFMVMATQNPIEQEGTYPLPEAQLDRFLLHVVVDYPSLEAEKQILHLARQEASHQSVELPRVISESSILAARQEVLGLHMAESVENYLVHLINATRRPVQYHKELASLIEFGASPRATIALDRCARAHAWLQGRDYVSPDDVQAVAFDVLRHRLILRFEAEAKGINAQQVIERLLAAVPLV
jgi:MoxR-like ATPase